MIFMVFLAFFIVIVKYTPALKQCRVRHEHHYPEHASVPSTGRALQLNNFAT